MKLGLKEIKEITQGAVKLENGENGIRFYRFTDEQAELYRTRWSAFYERTFCTAGVKLSFKTDSKRLMLKADTVKGSSRNFFSFDVFADGKCIGYLDNFSGMELPEKYAGISPPQGIFSKEFLLDSGEKTVSIYFPYTMKCELLELSIDDGATLRPVRPAEKLLAFGDSITHGYDALRPSNCYVARLADALGLELINKGIAGERFFPEIAAVKENIHPKYITVAYGSNDWKGSSKDEFEIKCRDFYMAISRNYPDAKIFAITPVWRKDIGDIESAVGNFSYVDEYIKRVASDMSNVTVIEGIDLIPHDPHFYGDLVLHPSDAGFEHYYNGVLRAIRSYSSK